ncbi:MAG TPA: hypothetical protein PLX33_11490 [Alphaproteobacteria bacterium]|nr:hypothetical protein [Alphaproteobacteria bacterium]
MDGFFPFRATAAKPDKAALEGHVDADFVSIWLSPAHLEAIRFFQQDAQVGLENGIAEQRDGLVVLVALTNFDFDVVEFAQRRFANLQFADLQRPVPKAKQHPQVLVIANSFRVRPRAEWRHMAHLTENARDPPKRQQLVLCARDKQRCAVLTV